MSRRIFAAAAMVMAAGVAQAADFPRTQSYSTPAAPYSRGWAGFYAGVNIGYQWGAVDNNPTRPAGVMGGVQAGYNWQQNQFVFGGETDLQVSGAEDTFAPWKFSNPWWGTLRARAGFTYSQFLFYVTGGLAYGSIHGNTLLLSENKTHTGWTAGVGAEVALNQLWTAKAEYLYVDLSQRLYTITGARNGLESNVIRFGLNYRF
ncbi:MAG: porin family protein [Pseudolabrys sp.]|nr:porin family protein [Pseudolabrys sp.]MBV9954981.1 porin family protein [Pseudolabrys sp.]